MQTLKLTLVVRGNFCPGKLSTDSPSEEITEKIDLRSRKIFFRKARLGSSAYHVAHAKALISETSVENFLQLQDSQLIFWEKSSSQLVGENEFEFQRKCFETALLEKSTFQVAHAKKLTKLVEVQKVWFIF